MLFSDNDEIDRFVSTFHHDRPIHDMFVELNFDKNGSILYGNSRLWNKNDMKTYTNSTIVKFHVNTLL